MSTRTVTHSLGNVSETTVAETATCRHCKQAITLLFGDWNDACNLTNCWANFDALYAPHEPVKEAT